MKSITEANWTSWNPSAFDRGDPTGQAPLVLLRMDNLMMDEAGVLRSVRGPKLEAQNQFPASDFYSIFSTILNQIKTRFVYVTSGVNKAILCTTTNPRNFVNTLINQAENAPRCSFLNTMGQVIMIAGAIQRKYDGTNNFPLGIAPPTAPTLSANATYSVDLNNLDGSGNYTNWSAVSDTTFDNSSTEIVGTGLPTASQIANNLTFQTAFSGVIDTTDLNGSGNNTDNDTFQFIFEIDDVTQLVWLRIELNMGIYPTATDYWFYEWDFDGKGFNNPFPISSAINSSVQLARSDWLVNGNPNWTAIKSIRVSIGISGTSQVTWSGFEVFGGSDSILTGDFNYVAVAADNNSGWYEFSPASTIVSTAGLSNQSITITPVGAVPSNANEYWLFRQDTDGGLYYFVDKQTGAYGFSPSPVTDFQTLDVLIEQANVNPLYNLQYYRQTLPTNIIDMIWFRDRVMYLATDGFYPSFKFDPGSYDARFVYQVVGSNNEQCFFIAKLDVGTFIIATNVDFYRVTGTFSIQIDPNDPTGQTQYQDVTITPLGVGNPAISHAWVEYQGSIMYVSADGIRVLTNATSTLINDNLDLLFRNESRYGLPAIQLLPRDLSWIAMATTGQRIYITLPHKDGVNRIYVLTVANQTNAMYLNTRSWRMITRGDTNLNPLCLAREEDGTIIYGGPADPQNYVYSIEGDQVNPNYFQLPIKFRTQFNYGGNPTCRKDALSFKCEVDTGDAIANLTIIGLMYDGSIKNTTIQFSTRGYCLIDLDIKEQQMKIFNTQTGITNTVNITVGIPPALAYAVEISCLTKYFKIQWFNLSYEERPAGTRRAIMFANNFGTAGRKRIAQWPFVANILGLLSNSPTNISANVTADGVSLTPQIFTAAENIDLPQTFKWQCDPTQDILALDWQIELIGDEEFELHQIMEPVIGQKTPEYIKQVINPASNFGHNGRKIMGVLPFRANLRGATITITLRVDGVAQPVQTFTNGDAITTFGFIPVDNTIGTDWEMEINVTSGNGIEFYGFLEPVIIQKFPEVTTLAKFPTNNFGTAGRKRVGSWPFVVGMRNHPITVTCRVDSINQTAVVYNPISVDEIQTIDYNPPKDLLGIDWQLKITSDAGGMEFYEFLKPQLIQEFPTKGKHAIQPSTNFGKAGPKKVATWSFIAKTLGNTLNVLVTIDGVKQVIQTVTDNASNGTTIQTFHWYNKVDIYGVDWQIEVYPSDTTDDVIGEFEFYKFMPPEIQQIFPVAKLWDQCGPLDFNKEAIVYGARFRVMSAAQISYNVLENDIVVFTDTIQTNMKDNTYIVKFPKGINASVCKILVTADQIFYRFSIEFKVRITGNDTDEKYVMMADANSK